MFSAQNFVLGVDWGYFLPKSQLSHQPKICKFLPILGIENLWIVSVAGATTLMNFLAREDFFFYWTTNTNTREDWPLLDSLSGFSPAHLRKRWLAFWNEKCYQLEPRKGSKMGEMNWVRKKLLVEQYCATSISSIVLIAEVRSEVHPTYLLIDLSIFKSLWCRFWPKANWLLVSFCTWGNTPSLGYKFHLNSLEPQLSSERNNEQMYTHKIELPAPRKSWAAAKSSLEKAVARMEVRPSGVLLATHTT